MIPLRLVLGVLLLAALPVLALSQEDKKPADKAIIVVKLPAEAKLTIDGEPTKATGKERRFSASGLQPGKRYFYVLVATWQHDDHEHKETKKVSFSAGHRRGGVQGRHRRSEGQGQERQGQVRRDEGEVAHVRVHLRGHGDRPGEGQEGEGLGARRAEQRRPGREAAQSTPSRAATTRPKGKFATEKRYRTRSSSSRRRPTMTARSP